jgi:hypothetical protein
MVRIIGVDFSGANEKRVVNTWVTEAQSQDHELVIEHCRPIKRDDLKTLLSCLPHSAVAAMDFPFSVPMGFANFWAPATNDMPHLWSAAASIEYDAFERNCNEYISQASNQANGNKHPLRIGDLYSSLPLSVLNLRMRRMTFYGMKLLHHLWESPSGFRVPPLYESAHKGPVLLEVMPGAALEVLGLPFKLYKNGAKKQDNRSKILESLGSKSTMKITNLGTFKETYRSNDDALDSLVAAVVAALWVAKRKFRCPSCAPTIVTSIDKKRAARASKEALGMRQEEAARLEGWIYVPTS